MKKKLSMEVCGGCAAKMGPGSLDEILKDLPVTKRDDILVGFDSKDDACIIKIDEEKSIIQTLDFFPTMVLEPEYFGMIAATNAMSDVYAMGGDVISALNIVCFPEDGDIEILKEILNGAAKKLNEVGASISGGHSIHDRTIKYGLSVTGIVDTKDFWKNDGAKEGDVLGLTKPLGTGLVLNARLEDMVSDENYERAIASMTTLNKSAKDILRRFNPSAVTDVTGFGLIGHLLEMTQSKGARINASEIEILPGAYEAASEFLFTAGAQRNRMSAGDRVKFLIDDKALEEVLFDPQTSGGLLFSAPKGEFDEILNAMREEKICAFRLGEVGAEGIVVDW